MFPRASIGLKLVISYPNIASRKLEKKIRKKLENKNK
jgi:hypothetical protein